MCGIIGAISFRDALDRHLLEKQRDTMTHRGPDSAGMWFSENGRVGFGHRRLAIVDLTPGGHQPMVDPLNGNTITFNGEIYNYLLLRDELIAKGHLFRTQSDTEVILAAYREWGVASLERLQGMFALAIHDQQTQRVLLARDRAGEKPLFYRVTDTGFFFASEAKALLADPSCPRRVKRESLNEYFAYGYVTGANTMFADIHRVLPGERIVIDLQKGGQRKHDLYWRLPEFSPSSAYPDDTQTVEHVHELLKGAVRRQLAADVPVGVLLSGGVDSSLVAAIAAEVSDSRIRTFTARFPGHQGFDEGPFARLVADHIGSEHIELETPPADMELLHMLVEQFDDPIADSSMIPTYLVSKEIRKHATVALGGDGGDELFGGYHRYPALLRQESLRRRIPRVFRRIGATVGSAFIPDGARGRGTLEALAGDVGTGIANAGRIYRVDERVQLSPHLRNLGKDHLQAPEKLRRQAMTNRLSPVQRGTAIDFSSYMVDDVLVKVDRASMLTSLEVRAPFLDVPVVEYAFHAVPDYLKATQQDRKVVLRRLGAVLLPPTLDLKRKQGFSIPVDSWMRSTWRPILDHVSLKRPFSLIDETTLAKYRSLLLRGRPVGDRLFAMVFLRLWEEHFRISDVI